MFNRIELIDQCKIELIDQCKIELIDQCKIELKSYSEQFYVVNISRSRLISIFCIFTD